MLIGPDHPCVRNRRASTCPRSARRQSRCFSGICKCTAWIAVIECILTLRSPVPSLRLVEYQRILAADTEQPLAEGTGERTSA